MRGDPERIMLWTQVITGLEVDETTAVHVLDAATWKQRRQLLQDLGGPPDREFGAAKIDVSKAEPLARQIS